VPFGVRKLKLNIEPIYFKKSRGKNYNGAYGENLKKKLK